MLVIEKKLLALFAYIKILQLTSMFKNKLFIKARKLINLKQNFKKHIKIKKLEKIRKLRDELRRFKFC